MWWTRCARPTGTAISRRSMRRKRSARAFSRSIPSMPRLRPSATASASRCLARCGCNGGATCSRGVRPPRATRSPARCWQRSANMLSRLTTFRDYLDARIFDLYDDPMPSRNDLEGYCGETASALIQLASLILDREASSQFAALAGHAGCAQAITGMLRLVPIHRARGQCYVPKDILAAAGTSPAEFLAGEGGASAARAVAAMAALAREHLMTFEVGARALPQALRPAFLPLALTGTYLRTIENDPAGTLRRTADIPVWRKHLLMLRRATRGWRVGHGLKLPALLSMPKDTAHRSVRRPPRKRTADQARSCIRRAHERSSPVFSRPTSPCLAAASLQLSAPRPAETGRN